MPWQNMSLNTYQKATIRSYQARAHDCIRTYINARKIATLQKEALWYSFQSGGKSLRACLVYSCGSSLGLSLNQLDPLATAIELAHTYSLLHDDLPCMDDDNFRRHRPSHHKAYPQAASILTGDALQAEAISILARTKVVPEQKKISIIQFFSQTLGSEKLIQGQWLDLFSIPNSLEDVQHIHLRKTADLFSFALGATFILKSSQPQSLEIGSQLGQLLGLAFQVQDDLLDHQANFKQLGKLVSSDSKNGRQKGVLAFINEKQAQELLYDLKDRLYNQLACEDLQDSLLALLIFGKILN